ncbi:hypothetical protein [Pontibacter sp. G13]|uniref:hypothetical protein n=1 Tax=Pontibacter sp. G13 TaxID=3074898 RepID=UPI002889DADE|nr:hypothetical protein [Pontibacter sp. G13]WNJ18138.1 hypothetical protein RJD25_25075 [Pontibacter sp. G13]
MKRQLFCMGLMLAAFGCNNDAQESPHHSNGERVISTDTIREPEHPPIDDSLAAIWAYDFDESTNDLKIIKLREFKQETLTPLGIENIINSTWPKVQIKYVKTINDTIVISIPQSEVLTQQMGTTGADQFMISTTYSFTELADVNFVKYEFEMGDHASPGVYDRQSWDEE